VQFAFATNKRQTKCRTTHPRSIVTPRDYLNVRRPACSSAIRLEHGIPAASVAQWHFEDQLPGHRYLICVDPEPSALIQQGDYARTDVPKWM
jgi:hypothetical protein